MLAEKLAAVGAQVGDRGDHAVGVLVKRELGAEAPADDAEADLAGCAEGRGASDGPIGREGEPGAGAKEIASGAHASWRGNLRSVPVLFYS
jgi:hypothetical protein